MFPQGDQRTPSLFKGPHDLQEMRQRAGHATQLGDDHAVTRPHMGVGKELCNVSDSLFALSQNGGFAKKQTLL